MSAALHPAVPGIDHLRRIASPATDFRVMPFGIAALDARLGRAYGRGRCTKLRRAALARR
jgi:hypothetical protein